MADSGDCYFNERVDITILDLPCLIPHLYNVYRNKLEEHLNLIRKIEPAYLFEFPATCFSVMSLERYIWKGVLDTL